MSTSAHIFNPKDNSFQERIRSYRSVLSSYRSMEANIERQNQKTWSDRLGTSEELEEAQVILKNSLKIASTSIRDSEIRKAEAQGLLTPEDMKIIIRLEREVEMQAIREEKQTHQQQDQSQQNNTFKPWCSETCFSVALDKMVSRYRCLTIFTMKKSWSSQTVMLHKDKQMRQVKNNPTHQPVQLDLFQMLINDNYSNSVELYQTLPDVFSGKQDKLRNPDGSLPVLSRQGMYNKTPYLLDISPANITITDPETGKRKKQAFYKTVVSEFVELALHKLSVAEGFFLNTAEVQTDQFGLITTYYQIRQELKSMGKHYSYQQIREGIAILAWLRYELSGDINKHYGLDSFFSPIDLIIRNDRKNPDHSELFITFNKLISKKILTLDWRSFNYTEFMKLKSSVGRALFLRLTYRFQQADPVRGYHFLLSTLIREGVLQDDLITTNIKKVREGLWDCSYIIDHYEHEAQYIINPETNRRKLNDYKFTVFPTEQFQQEQYRVNVHHKNIANHRTTSEWKAVIKPMRDQYPDPHSFKHYLKAQQEYTEASQ